MKVKVKVYKYFSNKPYKSFAAELLSHHTACNCRDTSNFTVLYKGKELYYPTSDSYATYTKV